jgi:hypothetical protein
MKRFYVALGGLISLAVFGAQEASAFGMGGMGGMFLGGRAFGMGGFSPGGFRGMRPGGFRGMSPGGFRGMSPGGFRGMSPNAYGRGIGAQNRAYMASPARLQTQRLNNGSLQNRSRLVDVNSTGSIRKNIKGTAAGRRLAPGPGPGPSGPTATQQRPSIAPGPNGAIGQGGPGSRGASGGDAGGYSPGLGSAGSSYYGAGSYGPTSYAANNHDAAAAGGAPECAMIRTKKPTKDGGHRWVIVERCERVRE